ncbi:MAG TPA: TonB-dependent receptor [Candidatus Xenobia bacterium]|nr:TonB-dependent receptor [Candidatus Xenobia bacterium]
MKTASKIGVLICLGLLVGLPVWAVTQNALVTGDIFDPKGAPVAGATVRLINAATGFSATVQTDASGHFTFPSVPPGENYVLSAEASGFATAIRPGITIQVGEAKLVLPPFLLQAATQPGQEITEEAPEAPTVGLDLVSTTVGGVIDSSNLRTLPLANRDFLDLALLIPGTYPVEQGSNLEGASLVVNGARATMNNFLLDGVDNNDYAVNQSLPFQLVEALQEFRVQTSTSAAEFGRSGGAQINSVTRSGSNDVHGTLFLFHRNDALSANQTLSVMRGGTFDRLDNLFRINRVVLGPATAFPTPTLADPVVAAYWDGGRTPPLIQNQFGANLGGPIKKDKIFAFFNWESFRADNDRPVFEWVPSQFARTCCGGNVSRDRVATLFNLYPAPNVPTSTVTSSGGFPLIDPVNGPAAFAVGQSENHTNSDNFLGRVDGRVSDRVNLSFKYNIQFVRQVQSGPLYATPDYPGSGIDVEGRNQNFGFNYLHQVTDRFFNEFRFGWNRFRLDTLPLDHTLNPSSIYDNLNFVDRGMPTVLIGGSFTAQGPQARFGAPLDSPTNRANNVWQFSDNISYIYGRHTLKVGGEIRHARLNVLNQGLARGVITFFTEGFAAGTGRPDLASIAHADLGFNGGSPGTDFVPGGGFDRSFSANSLDLFVQDTWRARKNVTVNFGLRYELNQAPREARDRLVNHYPGACPAFACLMRSGTDSILSPFLGPLGSQAPLVVEVGDEIVTLGTASFIAPRAGYETDKNNFGPHVGLAWDPLDKGKTVIRVSYGIFFDQESFQPSVNMLHNPPFVQQIYSYFPFIEMGDTFGPVTGPGFFPTYANIGGPGVNLYDLDGSGAQTCFAGIPGSCWLRGPFSIAAIDPERRTPYVHQWSVGFQVQVGSNSVFEADYVGAVAHKLARNRLILGCDEPRFSENAGASCARSLQGGSNLTSGSFPPGTTFDPEDVLTIINQENTANSNFHSLQLRFDTRQFRGLTLSMFYQWAKSIDDASSLTVPTILFPPGAGNFLCGAFAINCDQFAAVNTASNPALSLRPGYGAITTRPIFPQDSANLEGERGVSDFDVTHRFILRYIYDVPRFWGMAGSGWQLAGITTIQSGQPFSVYTDFFGIPLRPDVVSDPNIQSSNPDGAINGSIPVGCNLVPTLTCAGGTSAFDPTNNAFFLPGSQGRNIFRGDGIINFDLSILKNTYLGQNERYNLQLRMDVFNLFNHPNFRLPYSQGGQVLNVGFSGPPIFFPVLDPLFGQILQARAPREIQLGLKFIF